MTDLSDIGQTALGHLTLAKEFLESGRFNLSLEEIDKSLAFQPELAAAHFVRGIVLFKLADFDEAVRSLATATRLDEKQVGAWLALSHLANETNRLEDALSAARRAAAIDPSNPTAYLFEGNLLTALGRDEEAVEALRRAVELNPYAPMPRNKFCAALVRVGRDKEAELEMIRAHRLDPMSWRGRTALGDLLHGRGDHAAAVVEYRAAVELAAEHASVPGAKMARAQFELGDLHGALASLEQALELDERQVQSLLLLARIQQLLERPRAARAACERARALDPDYPPTKRQMEQLGIADEPG